jgi:hypothetical protein
VVVEGVLKLHRNLMWEVTLPNPTILRLEDEALIAVDVEKTLADAHVGEATSLAPCAQALRLAGIQHA